MTGFEVNRILYISDCTGRYLMEIRIQDLINTAMSSIKFNYPTCFDYTRSIPKV